MNDEQDTNEPQEDQAQAESPPAAPAAAPASSGIDSQEINDGKVFAILSYALSFVALPFFLVPLIMRNNDFSLYHAKQSLMIWLLGVASGVVSSVLVATLLLACVAPIVLIVLGVFSLVINIMGLINSCKGVVKPVPLIGKLGEDWFKGITKV